jgi:hypothetical protein
MIRAWDRVVLSWLGQAQATESPLLDLRIFYHAFEGRPVLRPTVYTDERKRVLGLAEYTSYVWPGCNFSIRDHSDSTTLCSGGMVFNIEYASEGEKNRGVLAIRHRNFFDSGMIFHKKKPITALSFVFLAQRMHGAPGAAELVFSYGPGVIAKDVRVAKFRELTGTRFTKRIVHCILRQIYDKEESSDVL